VIADHILRELRLAKRPVILFGAGILLSKTQKFAHSFLERINVPALTSRCSQDVVGGSKLNFGYIGSHATRYSNTILRKSDLIVSLGNRMAFNPDSATFGEIVINTRIIRVDVDENEFARAFPNTVQYKTDLADLMPLLAEDAIPEEKHRDWLSVCESVRGILADYDIDDPVPALSAIIQNAAADTIFTSYVGNNEFWFRGHIHYQMLQIAYYTQSLSVCSDVLCRKLSARRSRQVQKLSVSW
jgi:acetolactate synthase-1/2/3 large subunit